MKKNEFLKMMVQDNETESNAATKALHSDVIDCLEIALSQSSDDIDIDSSKSLKEAFGLIRKKATENSNCCGPFMAAAVLAEYLGVQYKHISAIDRFSAKKPKIDVGSFF